MLLLFALFAEHYDCLMIRLILQHLFDFSLLNGTNKVLVVLLNFFFKIRQYFLDLSQKLLELCLTLTTALIAALLEIALL